MKPLAIDSRRGAAHSPDAHWATEGRVLVLNRRQFLLACTSGATIQVTGDSAKAAGREFVPEAFGAKGNGLSDDYDALVRTVAAVNAARGGTVKLTPGRTYFLNRYVTEGSSVSDLTFEDCDGLVIEGNGAVIAVKGDFRRDRASTRGLAGLRFSDCRNVALRNLELVGNVDRTSRIGRLPEARSHGLTFQSCSDVTIDQILVRHFATDGMYIGASRRRSSSGTGQASRRFVVRNSRFLFNARQGLSVTQLRGGRFEHCEFAFTGYIDPNGTRGPYGSHAPTSGVDVEPNGSPSVEPRVDVLTGDLVFRQCRMAGNWGAAFVAWKHVRGQRFIEQVTLENCHFQSDMKNPRGYGFIFDVPGGAVLHCTLQMGGKTAYLGWNAASDANPRFAGNVVSGHTEAPNRPIFAVRPTRGAPIVEGNRFIGQQKLARTSADFNSSLIYVDNSAATVRSNSFWLPAEAFGAVNPKGYCAGVFMNAAVAEGNIYETNLRAGLGFFAIGYGPTTVARNEIYRGTDPGLQDSVRPIHRNSRVPDASMRAFVQPSTAVE